MLRYTVANLGKSYVIETGKNNNGYYRIYSDGYLEQWGSISKTKDNVIISFPKNFKDTDYSSFGFVEKEQGNYYGIFSKTISSFGLRIVDINAGAVLGTVYWRACGY